jgi:hypothetical protein
LDLLLEDGAGVHVLFSEGSGRGLTTLVWRQEKYKYHYHYAYKPRAKVVQESGRYILTVEVMGVSVEVSRV